MPRTEVAIGILILLLTAGIVVAFAASFRASPRKLFDLDPAKVPAQLSPEAVAAAELMPALPPVWRLAGVPQVTSADGLAQWGVENAAAVLAFKPLAAYRGRFETTDGSGSTAVVTVFDMGVPLNAFGLSVARAPKAAKALNMGGGGWGEAERVGFWSGRHYTEVAAAGPDAGNTAALVAQCAASRQLVYGRPFAAEAVLPAEDRNPGSLRYVRESPLGLAVPNGAFLADYKDGVTLLVSETKTARDAEQCVAAIREKLQAAGGKASVPESLGSRGAAGTLGDRQALVAMNGTMVIGAAGPSAEALGPALAAMDARLGGIGPAAGTTAARSATVAVQPATRFPDVPKAGLPAPADIKRFNRDTLYEKINGKAGVFLGFLFEELEFATYAGHPKGWQFDVYIFNMAEPVNAFGIYQTEFSHDAQPLSVARQGYYSGASVFFWKDKYYVNVLGPPDDAAALEPAKAIAEAVNAAITDKGEPFWADRVLPKESRKPNSLSYKATDAMGYSFLKQVFVADYTAGEKSYQLFVCRPGDAAAAKAILQQYAGNVKKLDGGPHAGGEYLLSEAMGVFEVVFVVGGYVGGVAECDSREFAASQAKAFMEKLAAAPAPAGDSASRPAAPAAETPAPAAEQESTGGSGEQG